MFGPVCAPLALWSLVGVLTMLVGFSGVEATFHCSQTHPVYSAKPWIQLQPDSVHDVARRKDAMVEYCCQVRPRTETGGQVELPKGVRAPKPEPNGTPAAGQLSQRLLRLRTSLVGNRRT